MKILFLMTILLISCGKIRVDVPDTNQEIRFGPDFKGVIEVCDERYGFKTEESELCFMDYRNYLEIEAKLNLDSIVDYCNTVYTVPAEITQCQANLSTFLGGV